MWGVRRPRVGCETVPVNVTAFRVTNQTVPRRKATAQVIGLRDRLEPGSTRFTGTLMSWVLQGGKSSEVLGRC